MLLHILGQNMITLRCNYMVYLILSGLVGSNGGVNSKSIFFYRFVLGIEIPL